LRFFAPQGRHVAPMGMKFGMEEGFHPHRCNGKGVGPRKLKFLLRFDRNVEYKRSAGAYPLRTFHKICRVCTSFQDALGVKIWLDLLKGLWSCMHCAKGDFPHAQYAFYLHTIDTRRAVKCGIAAVKWCDVTANHRCAAHSIPHFTFRIPHAAVPHFTHNPKRYYITL